MTAMLAIRNFIVSVALCTVCLILSVLIMKKSFLPCSEVRICSIPSSATCELTWSETFTVIELMSLLPLTRYMAVV